jgi:hypothetical protein
MILNSFLAQSEEVDADSFASMHKISDGGDVAIDCIVPSITNQ